MALSESAINSLAGPWGSYDFYLIRDRHFKTGSDMVERFLDRYQSRWKKSPRDTDKELASHPKAVKELLTEWAEKKLAVVAESEAMPTLQSNVSVRASAGWSGRCSADRLWFAFCGVGSGCEFGKVLDGSVGEPWQHRA